MDKRLEETKKNLKNALIVLLRNHELELVRISQIIQIADCARSTFYNHYDSIHDLLYEIIDETLEDMKMHIRQPYIQLEKIDFYNFPKEDVSLFTYLKENRELFDVLNKQSKFLDLNRFIADTIEELYVDEYHFQLTNLKVNPQLFKIYAANGIAAIIVRWMETGFKESPEYLADQAIELLRTASLGFNQKK